MELRAEQLEAAQCEQDLSSVRQSNAAVHWKLQGGPFQYCLYPYIPDQMQVSRITLCSPRITLNEPINIAIYVPKEDMSNLVDAKCTRG